MTPIHFPEIDSTNAWALANAGALPDGQWVTADRQTAGRGRRARPWVSEPGNLHASVLLRPHPTDPPRQQLSFVAALALHDAVAGHGPDAPLAIKWPNDLLIGGVKCAGILLESTGAAVVIGFGVNLAHAPAATERPATHLAAHGIGIAPPAFQAALAVAFATRHAEWRAQGFTPIRAAWLARAAHVGSTIQARLPDQVLTGTFDDLADDGALLLRLPHGPTRPIHAGEVFAL